jgi:hypothetical protein
LPVSNKARTARDPIPNDGFGAETVSIETATSSKIAKQQISARLTPEQIVQAQARAAEWLRTECADSDRAQASDDGNDVPAKNPKQSSPVE